MNMKPHSGPADEFCVMYPERSDYRENKIWRYHIVGKELLEQEEINHE